MPTPTPRRGPSTSAIIVRAGWLTLVTIGACILCARGSMRLWLKYDLPDIAVVRKVDYNEYIEETYQQFVSFAVAAVVHAVLGLSTGLPGSWNEMATVFWVGFLQNIFLETALQATGRRKMDLTRFASKAPAVISALVEATIPVAPVLARVMASTLQALQEGGMYFASFYFYGLWLRLAWDSQAKASLRLRAVAAAIVLPAAGIAFRVYACYSNGWPQPIVYGSNALGKRFMLSTIGFRLPQLACILVLLSQRHARATWLPFAMVQLPFLLLYFFMLRAMGRSYVESASADGTDQVAHALPLVADVASNIFRACEPLLGGGLVTLVTLAASGRLMDDKPRVKRS